MSDVSIESMVTITGAEYVGLHAEIDRLKAAVRVSMGQTGRLRNENERLHAVLEQIAAGRGDPVAVAHAAITQAKVVTNAG